MKKKLNISKKNKLLKLYLMGMFLALAKNIKAKRKVPRKNKCL
jgi:hypothetical protein